MDYQNSLEALRRRKGQGLDLTIVLEGNPEDEKQELDELGLAPMIDEALDEPYSDAPRDAVDGDMHAIDEELGDEQDGMPDASDLEGMGSPVDPVIAAGGLAQKPETYNMADIGEMLGKGGNGLPGKAAAYHASKQQSKNEREAKKDVGAKK